MPQDSTRAALLESIRTERAAMYFYLRAAREATDGRARRIFEKLAADERQHVEWFLDTYGWGDIDDLQAYLERGRDEANPWIDEMEISPAAKDSDLGALEFALHKEEELERQLRQHSATLNDPQLRLVYEVNADSTRQHYEAIRAELQRRRSEQPDTD